MALVLNEEQQMLKESAQGFLAEFAPWQNCASSAMQVAKLAMQIIYGDRWPIWAGLPFWFRRPMVV